MNVSKQSRMGRHVLGDKLMPTAKDNDNTTRDDKPMSAARRKGSGSELAR